MCVCVYIYIYIYNFVIVVVLNKCVFRAVFYAVNCREKKHDRNDDVDCFYIALFSALEQTHCARV